MDSCPYYEEVRKARVEPYMPCCRHKHTPAPCSPRRLFAQAAHPLRCGGHLSKCQIPPNLQLDIS
jgi:hypothetical protein